MRETLEKTDFVNTKRTVWHTAFLEIVQSIEQYTEIGTSVVCGDKKTRQIFPRVLFISADYEEQYVICDFNSNILILISNK